MERWAKFAFGLGGLSASLSPAFASPWGQEWGERLTISRVEYGEATKDDRKFSQSILQTYFEYGLLSKWTIGAKIGQTWQDSEGPTYRDSRSGFSEAELFTQRRVYTSGRTQMSVQALFAGPAKTTSLTTPGAEYGTDEALQLSGLYGTSWDNTFFAAQGGIRASLGDDADQFRTELSWGHNTKHITYQLDAYGTFGLTDADAGGVDYSLVSVAPSFRFPLTENFSLQLGGKVDLWGENLDEGYGVFISLWSRK